VRPFIGAPIVKVLTGIRRGGKSTLLRLLADELTAAGKQCLLLNFEEMALSPLLEAASLKAHLDERMSQRGDYCVLLDEVQEVAGWEKVVNSLLAEGRADLYITGSNSRLLSAELSTYIAGRYVEVEVRTLSWAEYLEFQTRLTGTAPDLASAFESYLVRGGFPVLNTVELTDEQARRAVSDIYASALIRDVLARKAIRQTDALEWVALFALDNVGRVFSANSIAKYFKSQRRRVDPDTVLAYLSALSAAFIVNKVPRFDLQGKQLLTVNEKYYAGDHGLVTALLGPSAGRTPGVLENIVWAELRRRGYQTYVGKLGEAEIDFVAEREGQRAYFQVTTTFLNNPDTLTREVTPLLSLKDAYPKYILSLEPLALPLDQGLIHQRIPDFLAGIQT
jgi:predicted AAA+ superfamily ATPase